jgi:hypothetical protein
MKPTGSEITTSPAAAGSEIGTRHGERGSATPSSLRQAVAATAEKHQGIVNFASSLTPPEATRFRAWVGVRAEATLGDYWERFPADVVKAEIIKDWIAILSPYSPAEIVTACRDWKADNPRQRPGPGDIGGLIGEARGRWLAAQRKPEPEVTRVVTAEDMERRRAAAADILRQAGFRMGAN